jgi:hypothetical protein
VTGRDAAFSLYSVGLVANGRVEHVAAAAAAVVEAARPWTCRGLVNLLGQAGPARVGQLWNHIDRARLLRIRDRYDPAGVFATNVVIG